MTWWHEVSQTIDRAVYFQKILLVVLTGCLTICSRCGFVGKSSRKSIWSQSSSVLASFWQYGEVLNVLKSIFTKTWAQKLPWQKILKLFCHLLFFVPDILTTKGEHKFFVHLWNIYIILYLYIFILWRYLYIVVQFVVPLTPSV